MNESDAIFVAGHRGLVGAALMRRLQRAGYQNLLVRGRDELDLTNQAQVNEFFRANRPAYVLLAAAKVGGIHANDTYPAEFLHDNLLIQSNVIDAAYRNGALKLLFLGSSCIYPRLAAQPIQEQSLLTGALEPTNEAYAIAKIAGIKMCAAYVRQYGWRAISLMPTNLYGPGDNFNLQNSHVLPALIRKVHEAKRAEHDHVVIWGSGNPRREFLHVDDLADAAIYLMNHYESSELINVGTGTDLTIAELAQLIVDAVGFKGRLVFDTSKPDGTPRKLLDVSRLHALGWRAATPLAEGIRDTYEWFLRNQGGLRA